MNINNLIPGKEDEENFHKEQENINTVEEDADEAPYENDDEEEQAEKDKLSGPGIDLVGQPEADEGGHN